MLPLAILDIAECAINFDYYVARKRALALPNTSCGMYCLLDQTCALWLAQYDAGLLKLTCMEASVMRKCTAT
eukprot:scaffold584203_cov24-Prasinocladus_malaysianus.AAC.1